MDQHFAALAEAAPDRAAIIDGHSGESVSRRTLLLSAEEVATRLREAGLVSGDLIAVQLPNSADFVAVWLAALRLALVLVPIDRDASATEVERILGPFGVRALVDRIEPGQPGIRVTTRLVDRRPPLPSETRLLKLTSGSSGRPRAIVTSRDNLVADCRNICQSMNIGPDDLNFGAIPFSHSYGFSNLVSPLLVQGTAVVISNDYLPQSILDLCNRFGCTVVPGIPIMFDHLSQLGRDEGDFRTARTFISAGAPLPPDTSRRFRERFGIPIHSFYGCSECGGITYDRSGGAVERGTVGAALSGVTLGVNGSRLEVQSASVAIGYLADDGEFQPIERGRFTTDDLAGIGDDGEVRLAGRSSEQINTAGKKVNPREIENVISQIAGVRQVKVYGEPAGARGDVVAAAVVASPDVTREQIREFCRRHLSAHKVPRIIKLIESIPVDERGKVKRSALASMPSRP